MNISLEDELQKSGTWKSQVEDIKKKLIETQQSLSQETQKCNSLFLTFNYLQQKFLV